MSQGKGKKKKQCKDGIELCIRQTNHMQGTFNLHTVVCSKKSETKGKVADKEERKTG